MAEEFREDYSRVSLGLLPFLSSVTKLVVQLRGDAPANRILGEVIPAADVFDIMGPLCGRLSHVFVESRVNEWSAGLHEDSYLDGYNIYNYVMEAVADLCPSSLTHLDFDMQVAKHPSLLRDDPLLDFNSRFDDIGPFEVITYLCGHLASFTCLTHLNLGLAVVRDVEVWEALPAALKSLHMGRPESCPLGLILPCLEELGLHMCATNMLKTLLQACDKPVRLSLGRLQMPEHTESHADLDFIVNHPAWKLANSGGAMCSPVTKLHVGDVIHFVPGADGYLSGWEILASLPRMPSIKRLIRCTMPDEDGDPNSPDVQHYSRLLQHIPNVFPNLSSLYLAHIPFLDSDLVALHACKSVHTLDIRLSKFVTGKALFLLAAALPRLVIMNITECVLVDDRQQQEIVSMLRKRVAVILQ